MCWTVRLELHCDTRAPATSRSLTRHHLTEGLGDTDVAHDIIDSAVLIACELVTNGVNAGATTVSIEIALHRDQLRVCVEDDAKRMHNLDHHGQR